jgi:hypothetical protein
MRSKGLWSLLHGKPLTQAGRSRWKQRRKGGLQEVVRGDVIRGKFRNIFEKPEPFVPGK